MSDMYKQRPSDIVGIGNSYAAYCFDEACMYIKIAMEKATKDNKTLNFDNGDGLRKTKIKHYSSMEEALKIFGI